MVSASGSAAGDCTPTRRPAEKPCDPDGNHDSVGSLAESESYHGYPPVPAKKASAKKAAAKSPAGHGGQVGNDGPQLLEPKPADGGTNLLGLSPL
jgi:hypothetical protein